MTYIRGTSSNMTKINQELYDQFPSTVLIDSMNDLEVANDSFSFWCLKGLIQTASGKTASMEHEFKNGDHEIKHELGNSWLSTHGGDGEVACSSKLRLFFSLAPALAPKSSEARFVKASNI